MNLTYRGIKYEREPLNIEVIEGEVAGKYRGREWQHHYPKHITELRPKLYMQYRGVAYSTRPVAGEITTAEQLKAIAQNNSHKKPRLVYDEAAMIHLDNMRRNLERRMEVAKESGNKNLVQMLEKECKELALTA